MFSVKLFCKKSSQCKPYNDPVKLVMFAKWILLILLFRINKSKY